MAGRPPSSIIDIYFTDIRTLYCNDGLGFRAIKGKLQERYGVHISHQTIMRRIEDWALEKGQQPPVYHVFRDPQVVAFVKQEWRDNCSHQQNHLPKRTPNKGVHQTTTATPSHLRINQ